MVERWSENRKSKRLTSIGGARNHVLWFRAARSCYLLALIASSALRLSSDYRQVPGACLLPHSVVSVDRIGPEPPSVRWCLGLRRSTVRFLYLHSPYHDVRTLCCLYARMSWYTLLGWWMDFTDFCFVFHKSTKILYNSFKRLFSWLSQIYFAVN